MDPPADTSGVHEVGRELSAERRRWWLAAALVAALAAVLAFALLQRPRPVCLAVATSLTGEAAVAGQESLAGVRLAIEEANRAGGIDGRPIELAIHDDASLPGTGRRNVAAIARSGCLGVLGHYTSEVSLATAPLYREAKIPALTASAFADALTEDNPWQFRAQITASMQARFIAEYLTVLNGGPALDLVTSDDSFGRGFAEAFLAAYPAGRATQRTFDPGAAARSASTAEVVGALPRGGNPRILVLGTSAQEIPGFLVALRRSGVKRTVVTTAGAGSMDFLRRFQGEPEERNQPGHFTNYLFAVPPVIFDSAGASAQAFAARYRGATHREPSWIAASYYDAARMMVEALRRGDIGHRGGSIAADRETVRVALAAMNGPLTGVAGLTRPLYFNARRNMPGPVRMGVFIRNRFMTASKQLVPVEDTAGLNIPAEAEAGHIVEIGGQPYWLQRVALVGVAFNRLTRIDIKEGTFNADLNLWLRYTGDYEAAPNIEFPDLLDQQAFDPANPEESVEARRPAYIGAPIGSTEQEPYQYRRYRIAGTFKTDYDLHDYPFDRQELLVRFLNRAEQRERMTYVVDSLGLELANSEKRLPSDLSPFRGLQQWNVAGLRYFIESVSLESSFGRPTTDPRSRSEFAGFNVAVELQRNYGIFLIKTMVPLVLLATVVFATLFLPGNLFRERINIPITAILTSSVLLLSFNNQLGDVGYTVALEYIFYAFFALCLAAMLVGITHDVISEQGHTRRAAVLARAGQLFYVAMVVLVIVVVWVRFAP